MCDHEEDQREPSEATMTFWPIVELIVRAEPVQFFTLLEMMWWVLNGDVCAARWQRCVRRQLSIGRCAVIHQVRIVPPLASLRSSAPVSPCTANASVWTERGATTLASSHRSRGSRGPRQRSGFDGDVAQSHARLLSVRPPLRWLQPRQATTALSQVGFPAETSGHNVIKCGLSSADLTPQYCTPRGHERRRCPC